MTTARTLNGFFAYGALPHSIPETIKAAIESINKTQQVNLITWEQLGIGGKYIVGEICDAIDEADFFCADITTINANVMFEVGFAIARDKRVWLVRDDSYTESKDEFEQLRLLTTIGYRSYTNADQIIKGFFSDNPHLTLTDTIFRESIEPLLAPSRPPEPLVYLKSRHDTEGSVRVSRVVDELNPRPVLDDPRESAVQPLYWYGQKILYTPGVIAHFLSPKRDGCKLTNARYALVSGLTVGFDTPLLMLSEHNELLAPMDYRDRMRYYTTPAEAGKITKEWIDQVATNGKLSLFASSAPSFIGAIKLATELKDFHQQLGEYVAENEATQLSSYFVETTAHMDIINGTQTIFVGRKGTGKTASLFQAANEIGRSSSNLVCILKPVGYEMEALARLFASYKNRDEKGYVIESLWKYLLYTELAMAASKQLREATPWYLGDSAAEKLIELIDQEPKALSGDFIVRLESVVSRLTHLDSASSAEQFRNGISEALHNSLLSKLRAVLSEALSRKRQVIILIDNLDKPWGKKSDTEHLTQFISGLLTAAERIGEELRFRDHGRSMTKFNSAIFLRSDIFNRITEDADEPDKISHTRLTWHDSELLLRVIEERYVSSHGANSDPADMWRKYFCSQVRGIPTRDYLSSRILPRPRDIVYFVKAAVSFAVNRKRDRVEEKDVLDAEMQYSQYAWDSVLVESSSSMPALESVLLEFVGGPYALSQTVVRQHVSAAGVGAEKVDDVILQLITLTFLGVEVGHEKFAYSDEKKELQKNLVLAARFAEKTGAERRFQVNAPFRTYLSLQED